MDLLKENLFLVVILAVLVVGGSVLVFAGISSGGKADVGSKEYTSLSKEMDSLISGRINQKKVDDARQQVEKMRQQAERVKNTFLLKNRRDYKVLSFDISGSVIPAFPIDPEFKSRDTLRLLFPGKYHLELKSMRESLRPTVPPTSEEIRVESERISASAAPARTTGVSSPGGSAGERERYLEGMNERERMMESGRFSERGVMGAPVSPSGTAVENTSVEKQAITNLTLRKSDMGWIYVDEQSSTSDRERGAMGGGRALTVGGGAMFDALPQGRAIDDESLWMAQVGLWVQRDIVDAINLTNQQAMQIAPGARKGVAASAVKRLMNINVRGYVVRSSGTSGDKTTSTLQYLDLGDQRGSSPVSQLTQRACNKLYDVLHYDFTVVIPMHYLLALQSNLMAQNYHTILEVNITRPAQSDLHYYGNDSVMKVNIVGEMLMLTDWTRGRWDADSKEWYKDFPPLMPEEFLQKIKGIDAAAIRNEDNQRIPASEPDAGSGGRGGFGGRVY